jgi:16S rRNA processing protein RimM
MINDPLAMNDLVAIARVAKPRGIRGEVIADLLTDFPQRFQGLKKVTAVSRTGDRQALTIENYWFQANRIVLKFLGFDSMNDAEQLRGSDICVNECEVVELGPDEYYEWHLVGCSVDDVSGRSIGTVTSLMRIGESELLVVSNEEKETLIPFVKAICLDVDVGNKKIVVDPPEGLLEM